MESKVIGYIGADATEFILGLGLTLAGLSYKVLLMDYSKEQFLRKSFPSIVELEDNSFISKWKGIFYLNQEMGSRDCDTSAERTGYEVQENRKEGKRGDKGKEKKKDSRSDNGEVEAIEDRRGIKKKDINGDTREEDWFDGICFSIIKEFEITLIYFGEYIREQDYILCNQLMIVTTMKSCDRGQLKTYKNYYDKIIGIIVRVHMEEDVTEVRSKIGAEGLGKNFMIIENSKKLLEFYYSFEGVKNEKKINLPYDFMEYIIYYCFFEKNSYTYYKKKKIVKEIFKGAKYLYGNAN